MIKSSRPALDLSFTCLRKVGGGIVYWNVETTGSYVADLDRGAAIGAELEASISAYENALTAWYAARVDGNLPDRGPEPEAYNATSQAFIRFQCATDAEVQRKLQFVASCQDMKEEIEGGKWFKEFNASLILPVAIDPILGMAETFQPHQNGEDA